jgi:hypothetical protein
MGIFREGVERGTGHKEQRNGDIDEVNEIPFELGQRNGYQGGR